MKSVQIQAFSEPPLAATPQLSEKPRQGFETKKTARKPGSSSCNFKVTLGLRATVVENGVRETYSARYYNLASGRFASQDPENGIPIAPLTLHKYMYAGGDPVNLADPTGRAQAKAGTLGGAAGEYAGLIMDISIASVAAIDVYACGVNVRLAMDALQTAGYTNVVPVWFLCSAKGKRVSCRYNVNIHIIGTPNHDSLGPFVGYATGRGCTETCSVAQAQAYAIAVAAAAGRPYHIIHENQYCSE